MTKQEVLKEIEATRYKSRVALRNGEPIEAAALDRVTDRLVAKAQNEMSIDWEEIKAVVESANEKARGKQK